MEAIQQTLDLGSREKVLFLYGTGKQRQIDRVRFLDRIGDQNDNFPFLLSLRHLQEQLVFRELSGDIFLTDGIRLGLNQKRPQYADYQDMRTPREVEENPKVIEVLRRQLETHFGEMALNRNLFYGNYEWNQDGRLKSPFQEKDEAFALGALRQIIADSQEYLKAKFGVIPNQEELEVIDENFEEIIPLIFGPQFMETRVGLELAEYMGIRRFEKIAEKAQVGDVVVIFSPYSPHRGTAYEYQFTNIGIVEKDGIRMIYGRTEEETGKYLEKFRKMAELTKKPKMAWEVVSSPILIGQYEPNSVLAELGVVVDPEVIELFDRAIFENKEMIDKLIGMMTDGKHSEEGVREYRKNIERALVNGHKELVRRYRQNYKVSEALDRFFAMVEKGYLRGGLCGFSLSQIMGATLGLKSFEDAGDGLGPKEFECPHCHSMVSRPFGKLVENCPSCGGSCRCD